MGEGAEHAGSACTQKNNLRLKKIASQRAVGSYSLYYSDTTTAVYRQGTVTFKVKLIP